MAATTGISCMRRFRWPRTRPAPSTTPGACEPSNAHFRACLDRHPMCQCVAGQRQAGVSADVRLSCSSAVRRNSRPPPSCWAFLLHTKPQPAACCIKHRAYLYHLHRGTESSLHFCALGPLLTKCGRLGVGNARRTGQRPAAVHAYYRPPAAPPCWHHLTQPSCRLERQLLGPRVQAAPRHGSLVVQPALRQAQSKTGDPPCMLITGLQQLRLAGTTSCNPPVL